jgi:glyceraldehyde 3-phosphate dehydrogenase
MSNIAISGFGRIGRTTLKIALGNELFVPNVITDIKDLDTLAALLKYDSNYGRWPGRVHVENDQLFVDDHIIKYINTGNGDPDWAENEVELVIDCTGRCTTRPMATEHFRANAKKVLVSAPSKTAQDADAFLLWGINFPEAYDPAKHNIISMASCTTNALAPMVKVIQENFGIEQGFFSTIHAYTNSQSLIDQPMKDRRDSWSATENIIPSSSGAAKSLQLIWPGLNITGKAYRVPVKTGSIVELVVNLAKPVANAGLVKNAFALAAISPHLKGIMRVSEEEIASSAIVGDDYSCIVDLPLTQVLSEKMLSVAAWYDNEWGYSARLAEMAKVIADSI